MNKYLIIALAIVFMFLTSVTANAAVKGLPFTDDQYAHAFGSAYLTKVCKDIDLDFFQTTLVIVGLGVAKELYDMNSTGFNSGDILTNCSGLVLAYSFDFVLDV